MDHKVEEWLQGYGLPIERLPKKWQLPTMAVIEAADSIYNKTKNGYKVKPIRIGWEIRGIASLIANTVDIEEVRNIQTAHETILSIKEELSTAIETQEELSAEIEQLKTPKIVKLWRFMNKPLWGGKNE